MRKLSALVIAGIASLGGVAPADAADMPRKRVPVRVIKPIPVPVVIDVTSGWYVRADFGHRWYSLRGVEPATGFAWPADNRISSGWFGGIGAGFKQDWLRVDVTADYGTSVTYAGSVVTGGGVSAKLRANTALLNAYYEPYTWNGFTPYLGVGAGVAHVHVSDYSSTVVPPLTPVGTSNQWNFAYAAMAGASFALTPRVLLDVGYRYLALHTAYTLSDSSGRVAQFRDIAAHELRFGVRFFFPDPVIYR